MFWTWFHNLYVITFGQDNYFNDGCYKYLHIMDYPGETTNYFAGKYVDLIIKKSKALQLKNEPLTSKT